MAVEVKFPILVKCTFLIWKFKRNFLELHNLLFPFCRTINWCRIQSRNSSSCWHEINIFCCI